MPITDFTTQFDDEVLPAGFGTGDLGYSGNGRQIVSTSDGRFVVGFSHAIAAPVFTGGRTPAGRRVVARRRSLFLVIQDGPAGRTVPFEDPLLLAGDPVDGRAPVFADPETADSIQVDSDHDQCDVPSLVIDGETLHVIWRAGNTIRHTAAPIPKPGAYLPPNASGWRRLDGSSGADELAASADIRLGDVLLTPRGLTILFSDKSGLFLQLLVPGGDPAERTFQISDTGINPVAEQGPDGSLHIAFERDNQIYYCRAGLTEENSDAIWMDPSGKPAAEPAWRSAAGEPGMELVGYFPASRPSMVLYRGHPLIAFQGEGVVSLTDNLHLYSKLRAAGGTSVGWCRFDGENWRHGELIRSKEILLKRDPRQETGGVKTQPPIFLPRLEEVRLPQLALDANGVPWLFYTNVTRRHTYWSRWLGEDFGDRMTARGPYYGLSPHLMLQKHPNGVMGWVSCAMGRLCFHHTDVPDFDNRRNRRVVFLDMLEVAGMKGVTNRLGVMERHPANPLAGPGITGSLNDGSIMFCKVFETGDGFELVYRPYYYNLPGRGKSVVVGPYRRMLSEDGISWRHIDEPYHGPGITADYPEPSEKSSEAAATIDGEPVAYRPFYIEDPDEKDPQMRYKGLVYMWKGYDRISGVITSPDARTWRLHDELPPVIRGEDEWLLVDDAEPDPRYRYKLFIKYIGLSGRTVMEYTSPDLLHWEANFSLLDGDEPTQLPPVNLFPVGRIVIDPDAAENPYEEEVHATRAWRENGILMLHYDAFMLGANQHVSKALAVSRDGFNFSRVKQGSPNLPRGPVGSWESGRVRTLPPIRRDGKLWVFYVSGPPQLGAMTESFYYPPGSPVYESHFGLKHERPRHDLRLFRLGLATIREDGWGFLRGKPDADERFCRTIPIALHADGGPRLYINAELCRDDAVRIEVLNTETGTVMEGYGASDCRIDGTNGTWMSVTWGGEDVGKLAPREIALKIIFGDAESRLYSFGFGEV